MTAGTVGEPGPLGGPPASLAGDQLVAPVDDPHEDRLEHAELGDRGGQLAERLLVEVHPRLVRVGHDVGDRDLGEHRPIADRAVDPPAGVSAIGMRELSPLPKPLRRVIVHLLGHVAIGDGAA